jgi:hypothetical protein
LGYLLKAPSTNKKYGATVPYFSTKCNKKHCDQCPLLLQHTRFVTPSPQDSGLLKQKHPTFFSSKITTEIQVYVGTYKPVV